MPIYYHVHMTKSVNHFIITMKWSNRAFYLNPTKKDLIFILHFLKYSKDLSDQFIAHILKNVLEHPQDSLPMPTIKRPWYICDDDEDNLNKWKKEVVEVSKALIEKSNAIVTKPIKKTKAPKQETVAKAPELQQQPPSQISLSYQFNAPPSFAEKGILNFKVDQQNLKAVEKGNKQNLESLKKALISLKTHNPQEQREITRLSQDIDEFQSRSVTPPYTLSGSLQDVEKNPSRRKSG